MTSFNKINAIFYIALFFVFLGTASCERNQGDRMYDSAIEFWKKGNYDEALQNLIALTKSYPDHSLVDDALFITAGIYHYYLDEPKNAIRFYRILNKNFTASDYYVDSMVNLAGLYEKGVDEDKRKAIEIYKLLARAPNSNSYDVPIYRMARMYLALKDHDRARQYLKKLIQRFPDSDYAPQAYLMIGYSYYGEGMIKLAKITFVEATQRYKDTDKALNSIIALANIHEELNQLKSAINTYASAKKKITPQNSLYDVLSSRINLLKNRLKKIKR